MFAAVHKHANPRQYPVFNALGHLASVTCIVLLFFGHRLLPGNLVSLFVPVAMIATGFLYLLWCLTAKTTALIIPTVFWTLFGILVAVQGFPAWL